MKKEEFIEKHCEEEYIKRQERVSIWKKENPERVLMHSRKHSHKGGVNYEKTRAYQMSGLQHVRSLIRWRHGKCYFSYKKIIAPDSQIHHQWLPGTADYTGVALVEKDPHLHGFIDVIQILEGEITLLTEAEISWNVGQ